MTCKARLQPAVVALLVLSFTIAAAAAGFSSGQPDNKDKDYALIFGTVWSRDNRAVPGAKVKIRRSDEKKARWTLVSDRRGEFAQRVPPGKADYQVWVEGKGKKRLAETTVHVELDERSDIGLHLTE